MVSVTVKVHGKSLIIEPKGRVSKLAALKRRLAIPLDCVRKASTAHVPKSKIYRSIRVGGTALPPHYAGRFYNFDDGLIFCALSDPDKCVSLTLEGFRYKEIIVQVDDKEEVAAMVRKALAGI
ncbi:hypothetical protein [Candidatus Nitrososphaera sp. FF02]|uniref:hypothetical protein n=1 Tax=Candidatus Nitrososphaera sp. FF02 TaxID=3398226 RepID=UPI0039ED94E8